MAIKDPDAIVPFRWDWTDWLETGDAITSHELVADGVGVESSAEDGGVVVAVVAGGTAGRTARVVCRVTTANGFVDDRTLTLRIVER